MKRLFIYLSALCLLCGTAWADSGPGGQAGIAGYTGPGPLPLQGGGTGCPQTDTLLFSQLPASPHVGTECMITDATVCLGGSLILAGGGTMICPVQWNGANWLSSGNGLDRGTGLALPNSATGTTSAKLAVTAAGGTAEIAPAGAVNKVLGPCVQGCTSGGMAIIQLVGTGPCVFSGGITYGDYAQVDPSIAGDCVDGGMTFPTSGGEVVGTIVSPTNAAAGTYNVALFGPDVANSTGGGGGGISTGVVGNSPVYGGINAISPIPFTIHAGTGTLQAAIAKCPVNNACDIIADPGQTYNVNSPIEIGGPHQVGATNMQLPQTLWIDNANVVCGDTTPGNVDDCIVLGTTGKLFCTGNGDSTHFSGIQTTSTAQLNSIVGSLGGVILNSWQATHTYLAGQFLFDGTNTQRVSIGGTSGGGTPTWATTPGSTTVDGGVTWIYFAAGRLGGGGGHEWLIDGCHINGTTSASASINSIIHISGVAGGFSVMRDVTYGGISSHGIDSTAFAGHGTGLLIDDGQTSAFCTAASTPLACCTGSGTGTCQSGSGGTQGVLVENTFLGPGSGGSGPSYGVHVAGSGTANVTFLQGQIADIVGSQNLALFEADNLNSLTVQDMYFEIGNGSASEGGSDAIVLNNVGDASLVNNRIAPNGTNSPLLTNCIHIKGSGAGMTRAMIVGRVVASNSCTNVLTNDIDATGSILGNSNQSLAYHYGGTTATGVFDFQNMVDFVGPGMQGLFGPGLYYSAAGTAIPGCAAKYARQFACVSDSTACTAATTYTSGGGTSCLLQCNNAGSAWKETGVICQ